MTSGNSGLSPVIPTIDVAGGRTTEPSGISGLDDPSDPVEVAARYREQGAEGIFLDILDPWEDAATFLPIVRRAAELGAPLWVTVHNGVARSVDDLALLLDLGAAAVGISTTSVERPSVLHDTSRRFGAGRVVGVMNVRRAGDRWNVVVEGGETETPLDACTWAAMLADLGAGCILPNSLDQEGTGRGYDLDLVRAMTGAVSVPVVASGGCGTLDHLVEGLAAGATYVLTNKMLHNGSHSVAEATRHLREALAGVDDRDVL
ncbi:HisA/HisF-related TIM barrel protein [Bailinhaonella thermotolerans]|nr:HisA/HisF-related TIM barrel protein [Bailinhaonella thermotolerans]